MSGFFCTPFSSLSLKGDFRKKKKSVCIGGRELYKKISLRVGEIAPWLRMGCSCRGPELHSQHPCWTAHNHLHATAAPRHLMPPRKKRLHEIHTDPPPAVSPNSISCLCPPFLVSPQPPPGQLFGLTSIPGGPAKSSAEIFGAESVRVGGNLFAVQ